MLVLNFGYNSSMTRLKESKLNFLMTESPSGEVLTSNWFNQHGISNKLVWWYVHSNWLERLASEAYKKVGDHVNWAGAIAALQHQLKLPIHVASITALQLLGIGHFVTMGGFKYVTLFSDEFVKTPKWFFNANLWNVTFKLRTIKLFNEKPAQSLVTKNIEGVDLTISSPELAILELLYLTPNKQPFDEAVLIMEKLTTLRPGLVQLLLEQCLSFKVKRIFLSLSERFYHPWLSELDFNKFDLGRGKRMIGSGGHYDSKYQISMPKILEG